ncbi:hypothetical protein DL769_005106 [Monosporascus sp. CRB-8-3]|nr:hypothetical protein DL769_005106 [Monosporascus sp. CRB-8-3]
MHLLLLLGVLSHAKLVTSQGWSLFDINHGEWSEVIERDICIIGGGSSGVHAAVSLVDSNKTVVIVERNDRLGGHTHTYTHPETGMLVDIGVVVFQPFPVVYDYFDKFKLPLLNLSSIEWNEPGQPPNKSQPAAIYNTIRIDTDFRDGSDVTRTLDPEAPAAFQRMVEVLSKYSYVLDGYDLPDPVPEDPYMPFGAFLEKYDLMPAFQTIYQVAQGMGDLLHISTIYAIKYFNLGDFQALTQGYLTHARGNNSELYTEAGQYIGVSNILLESYVVATNRKNTTSGRLEMLASTRNHGLKLMICSQALLTIPPTLDNLRGWDLTSGELAVFSQFVSANGYYTGLVKGVGLNQTVSHYNAAANTPFNIPVLPAMYALAPVGTIEDVWWIKFGANNPTMTDAQVKSYVLRQIQTIQRAVNATVTEPEWLVYQSHTPFHLQVAPEAIKDGFFRNLTALQGGFDGRMFYSGAAFHTQYSTYLWRYNQDVVIPLVLKSA